MRLQTITTDRNTRKMNTLDYYNRHAAAFSQDTFAVDFSKTQERFLSCLPSGARILDFGCGAGRDTVYFRSRGFSVDPVDGSEEMCRAAEKNTGASVRQMLFGELDETEAYDGIWACASVLHVPSDELPAVFSKMIKAAKHGGALYLSFKYGTFEGERNGRYFTDFTEDSFLAFLRCTGVAGSLADSSDEGGAEKFPAMWVTNDVRPDREDERWLNILLKKA